MRTPTEASFTGRLWLDKAERRFLGKGRVQLLALIGELGSITRAAKAMGMSYKAAWEAVELMNNLSDQPIVVRTRGGAGGGETRLTDYGRELVTMFQVFHEEHGRFLAALSERLQRANTVETLLRRFGMRTSARNQYWGRVVAIQRGAVNAEIALALSDQGRIVASITNESVDALELKEGREACALIKASFVIIGTDGDGQRTSARNCLSGKVSRCWVGAVNGEVTLAIAGGRSITAIISNESIRSLGLAVGKPAYALVKASHVIVAVND
jgi:molybdate transport system regulatory protein